MCWRRQASTRCRSARPASPAAWPSELAERGLAVAPRGPSTLVSFEVPEPQAFIERLARDEGMVLRFLPGTPYVRASVGGWSSEEELERLVALAGAA